MLQPKDRQAYQDLQDAAASVIREVVSHAPETSSTAAILALVSRCAGTHRSIHHILKACADADEHELCNADAAALLRCMHEVCLQAEYISAGDLKGNLSSAELGERFLDYSHVERFKYAQAASKQTNRLATALRSAPQRGAGEEVLKREYDRVAHNYPSKRCWYRGNLSDVARAVNREDEYFWFSTMMHASVHGGPSACHVPYPPHDAGYILPAASAILGRALRTLVRHTSIEVPPETQRLLKETEIDILNPKPP